MAKPKIAMPAGEPSNDNALGIDEEEFHPRPSFGGVPKDLPDVNFKPEPNEKDLIFAGIQSLNRARKKLSPAGQKRLLQAIQELFGE